MYEFTENQTMKALRVCNPKLILGKLRICDKDCPYRVLWVGCRERMHNDVRFRMLQEKNEIAHLEDTVRDMFRQKCKAEARVVELEESENELKAIVHKLKESEIELEDRVLDLQGTIYALMDR